MPITYDNKVSNGGATSAGRWLPDDANEVKAVVNTYIEANDAALSAKADASALDAKADEVATAEALANKASTTTTDGLTADLSAVDGRVADIETDLGLAEPMREPTVADLRTGADRFLSFNPKILADASTPVFRGVAPATLTIDASAGSEQIYTLSANCAVAGCTDTLEGAVIVWFVSTGSFSVTLASDIRVTDTNPAAPTSGQEVGLIIAARTASNSVRRTVAQSFRVYGAPALVAPVIVSTSVAASGSSPPVPWSNTPGATFSIVENVTGNLAPTVTRTMTFNGAADAQTGSTFTGPVGLRGKFRITTAAINASGSATPVVTEAWIGKRAPDWIGETHADNTAGAGVANFNIAIHASAIAGDTAILATQQQSPSDIAPPTGFGALGAAIPRVAVNGTVSGNNQHFQLFRKVLDAADILAGVFSVTLNSNSFALLTILRGEDSTVWDPTKFVRSASLVTTGTANSPVVAPTDGALMLVYVYSGGYEDGPMICSATGFTRGTTFDLTGTPDNGVSDYGIATLRSEVSDGTFASFPVTIGTSVTKTTQVTICHAYGPVNA